MPEVSFYILPTDSSTERDLLICKLAEKAYRQGIYSFILSASEHHSKILDDLLWTFRASSFIPHQIASTSNTASEAPKQILISHDQHNLSTGAALINAAQQFPQHLSAFERILEIVPQAESALQAGRERYRRYQQLGLTPLTHKL